MRIGNRPGAAGRIGAARMPGRRSAAGPDARVEERRALRPRDHGPRPGRQRQLARPRRCGSSTGRRSGGSARPVPSDPMPGFSACPVTSPRPLVAGGAIARIGRRRQRGREGALEDDQVPGSCRRSGRRPPGTRPASGRTGGCSAGTTARSRGTDRPSPTRRMFRVRSGGTTAQARSSMARRSGRGARVGAVGRDRRTSTIADVGAATSSTIDVGPRLGVDRDVRVSRRWSSPQTSTRRVAGSRSRLATLTKTERVTRRRRRPDGERDDRLVAAALRVADPEDPDRRVDLRRRRRPPARRPSRRGPRRRRTGPRAAGRARARRRGRPGSTVGRIALDRLPDPAEVARARWRRSGRSGRPRSR